MASNNNDLFGITTVGALTSLLVDHWCCNPLVGAMGATPESTNEPAETHGTSTAALTMDEQAITLSNGANQNVTLPSNAGTARLKSPTANYSIGGIAGEALGGF